jgi:effector-binding domain-containing protein
MGYEIEVIEVQATPLAAVAVAGNMPEFAQQIRRSLDEVYAFLETHESVRQKGHNVIFYDGPFKPGSRVMIGVQVDATFPPVGNVVSTTTPAGRVARTMHVGSYSALGFAHTAIVEWCKEHGLQSTGRGWEVYGDMHDDPAKLETEVMHLLA